MEDKKVNLDFSVQAYWAAFTVCTLLYVAFETGIIEKPTGIIVIVLGCLLGFVVSIGYVWYKRSKVTATVSFSKEDVGAAFLSSLFAQWGFIIALLIPGIIGYSPQQNNNDQEIYYENCTDARYQGADPVYSDDPGYNSELDRDGDGIGCE